MNGKNPCLSAVLREHLQGKTDGLCRAPFKLSHDKVWISDVSIGVSRGKQMLIGSTNGIGSLRNPKRNQDREVRRSISTEKLSMGVLHFDI